MTYTNNPNGETEWAVAALEADDLDADHDALDRLYAQLDTAGEFD